MAPSTNSSNATTGGVQVPAVRPAEQSISTNFLVLVMNDPDTGQPTLCSATDAHESIAEVNLARVLEQATEAYTGIDAGVQMALAHEAQQHETCSGKDQHFQWCQPGACLTLGGDDGTYIEHQGVRAAVPAPGRVEFARGSLVDARLAASTEGGDPTAVVSLIGADGNGAILDAAGLDKLISDTSSFLHQLRLMRLHVTEVQA